MLRTDSCSRSVADAASAQHGIREEQAWRLATALACAGILGAEGSSIRDPAFIYDFAERVLTDRELFEDVSVDKMNGTLLHVKNLFEGALGNPDGDEMQMCQTFVYSMLTDIPVDMELHAEIVRVIELHVLRAQGGYDARLRALLDIIFQVIAASEKTELQSAVPPTLGVAEATVASRALATEETLVVGDVSTSKSREESVRQALENHRMHRLKRWMLISASAAAGGALLGVTGGLAAAPLMPVFAAIGAGVPFLSIPAASVSVLLGSLFGTYGAVHGGSVMRRRFDHLQEISFEACNLCGSLAYLSRPSARFDIPAGKSDRLQAVIQNPGTQLVCRFTSDRACTVGLLYLSMSSIVPSADQSHEPNVVQMNGNSRTTVSSGLVATDDALSSIDTSSLKAHDADSMREVIKSSAGVGGGGDSSGPSCFGSHWNADAHEDYPAVLDSKTHSSASLPAPARTEARQPRRGDPPPNMRWLKRPSEKSTEVKLIEFDAKANVYTWELRHMCTDAGRYECVFENMDSYWFSRTVITWMELFTEEDLEGLQQLSDATHTLKETEELGMQRLNSGRSEHIDAEREENLSQASSAILYQPGRVPSLHVTIFVPGFLRLEDLVGGRFPVTGAFANQFSGFATSHLPLSECIALRWEPEALANLTGSIDQFMLRFAKSTASSAVAQGAAATVLSGTVLPVLLGALSIPMAVLSLSSAVDTHWARLVAKSSALGKVLAELIRDGFFGNRPISLVGHSLGARVIFSALLRLAERGEYSRVHHASLLGAPVASDETEWRSCRRVVSGTLTNAYSSSDLTLAIFHRSAEFSPRPIAGLSGVKCPGVHNIDLARFQVKSTAQYAPEIDRILSVLADETTRPHSTSNPR
ncbi:putative membrane protein [Porphyridium purpureum]|uniref:Putative membrane protein n=1 Tax=Porphyridium purpureum TaxID=35688 RepID=A0A5J4Z3R4_PORPP|nr:putative membrane protein [Porphyridium purpureum]|eukprot:POR4973..scf295_1